MFHVWFEKDHVRGEVDVTVPATLTCTATELIRSLLECCRAEGLVLVGVRLLADVQSGAAAGSGRMVRLSTVGGGRTLADAAAVLERLMLRVAAGQDRPCST